MSILTHSSRFTPNARAISTARPSTAAAFSSIGASPSPHRKVGLEAPKNVSAAPQFSATPRFRVLMAMEPARVSGEEESGRRFFENDRPGLEFKGGAASLNHSWEKLGFAINFVAIVMAIAYVVLT